MKLRRFCLLLASALVVATWADAAVPRQIGKPRDWAGTIAGSSLDGKLYTMRRMEVFTPRIRPRVRGRASARQISPVRPSQWLLVVSS